jgi:hypothetical protein
MIYEDAVQKSEPARLAFHKIKPYPARHLFIPSILLPQKGKDIPAQIQVNYYERLPRCNISVSNEKVTETK